MRQDLKFLLVLIVVLVLSSLVVSCDDDDKNVPVAGVSFDKTNFSMSKGTRERLEVKISPADATNKSIVWSSSDETIATIDRGVITTLEKGKTIITAKSADGGQIATCELTVTDWSKIILTTAKNIGQTLSLELLAKPENEEFIWIDLNNNGVKDEGEDNLKFSKFAYDYDFNKYPKNKLTIGAKKITIYGELTYLGCADNQITDLDFSQNTTIKYLECDNNQLTRLNIAKLKDLGSLVCANNKIGALDFSEIKYIEYLDCSKNQLTALDCSDTFLKVFDCSENQLETLNFATGLNNIIGKFNATINPDLRCIQLDKDFTPPSSWNKDETATWNNSGDACK